MMKTENISRVSVIIPTYDRAHLIGKAIQSVLDQTFQDFEILIIDDCSHDNTPEVVRSFEDDRITYIRHHNNRGGSGARNTGLEKSRGSLIAFLDDDNEWFNDKLERQVAVLDALPSSFGAVYCGAILNKGDKEVYFPPAEFRPVEGSILGDLLERSFIDTSAMLVRREAFRKAGFFGEDLPRYQDWELCIRIAKHFKIKYMPEPLYYLSVTDKSISTDTKAGMKAYRTIYETHKCDLGRYGQKHKYEYSIGQNECLFGDFSTGKAFLLKSIKTKALQLRAYLAIAIALFGKPVHNNFYRTATKILANPVPRDKVCKEKDRLIT